ncbi:hypothetical protein [Colwellia sp. Arc7-635]|nr:hypothetical protein [Colwellia sp. Arc7-635]
MTIEKISAIINEMVLDNIAKKHCDHSVIDFSISSVNTAYGVSNE